MKNTIGGAGQGDGQFNSPYFISIKKGVMYVADCNNHRVQKMTTRGQFLNKFGEKGPGKGQFIHPNAVIVDSNDRLIVADKGNNRIQILNEDGSWLRNISLKEFGCPVPRGLAMDPQGNISVTINEPNAIVIYTYEGAFVKRYVNPNAPRGIDIDNKGYSLVNEWQNNSLSIYDPQGQKIHTVTNLDKPWGISLDPRDCSVYVANHGNKTVLKYSTFKAQ